MDNTSPTAVTTTSALKRSKGSLHLIVGPMFASKTTMLAHYADRISRVPGNRLLLICSAKETRSGDMDMRKRFTHSGNTTLCQTCSVSSFQQSISEVQVPTDTTHVFLDEVQFFSVEDVQYYVYSEYVDRRGLHVYAFGLLLDSSRQFWPATLELMRYADKTKHLRSICSKCGEKSTQTGRIDGPSSHTQPKVGGSDVYFALCNRCYDVYALECVMATCTPPLVRTGGTNPATG